jgi:hypothetical protein
MANDQINPCIDFACVLMRALHGDQKQGRKIAPVPPASTKPASFAGVLASFTGK